MIVSAPHLSPGGRIAKFVHDNEKFILTKLQEFGDKRAMYYPDTYQSGDTFWHFGKKTLLAVRDTDETRAHFEDGILTLFVPKGSDYRYKKALFILWSTRTAKRLFEMRMSRLGTVFPEVRDHGVRISVRNMLSRWGSINTTRHTLSLSVHLLRCDHDLVDYVIAHELCHYAHANHSKEFYRVLERHYPNRKAIDKRLSEYGLVDF